MKFQARNLFILGGIFAPLLLFVSITLAGILWPGYDFINEYVSVLASDNSPLRIAFNLMGFALFGIIMIGLAFPLSQSVGRGRDATIGIRLFTGSGALIFLLGFFAVDRYSTNATFEGRMHTVIGNLAFIMLPTSILWLARAFKKDADWGLLWFGLSAALGTVGLAIALLLGIFRDLIFAGSVERLGMGAGLLWIFAVSFNLFLQSRWNLNSADPKKPKA